MSYSTELIRKHRKINTYVTDIEQIKNNPDDRIKPDLESIPSGYISLLKKRYELIRKYAFAIPNLEALTEIAGYKKIIELGCGTAYWAYLLRELFDIEIIAMDAFPIQFGINPYFSPAVRNKGENKGYYLVEQRKAFIDDVIFPSEAMIELTAPTRALFLCWPSYEDDWGFEWLERYYKHGGQILIYIGEGYGGCTGTDEFHDFIGKNFEEIKHVKLEQYEGIHDSLTIYKRSQ